MQTSTPKIDHAVVSVLIADGDKYLLVQEGKPGRQGLYGLPGGHVEAHETLFQAALREVKEETGFIVELTGVVGIYQGISKRFNISGPVFSAKVVGGNATSSNEHPESRWVTKTQLYKLAKAGKLFTKYPPYAVNHYLIRGPFPLDIVASYEY